MNAALLFGVLLGQVSQPFWDKDLPALAVRVTQPGEAAATAERALFRDVLSFVSCAPLPPVSLDEPLGPHRQLLRLEAARGHRLGATRGASATLWSTLSRESFFTRRPPFEEPHQLLVWPVEDERWPNERWWVPVPSWQCADATGAEAEAKTEEELPSVELIFFFEQRGEQEVAERLRYHRAVLQYRAGAHLDSRTTGEKLNPGALSLELQPHARLLRVLLGLEPSSAARALLADLPRASDRVQLWAWYAHQLSVHHRLAELHSTVPYPLERCAEEGCRAHRDYVHYLQVEAMARAGHSASLLQRVEALLADPSYHYRPPLMDWVWAVLRDKPFDATHLSLVQRLAPGAGLGPAVRRWGEAALLSGNLATAAAAAAFLAQSQLPAEREAGQRLLAETAFARGDLPGFTRAVAAMSTRTRAAKLQLIANVLAFDDSRRTRGWNEALRKELEGLARSARNLRERQEVRRLLVSLEGGSPSALYGLGAVRVEGRRAVLAPPPSSIEWVEPYSLLALPHPEGGLRAWFLPEGSDAS